MLNKKDLRTGMKVTTRNGDECIVLLNIQHEYSGDKDIIVGLKNKNWWLMLSEYNDNLTYKYGRSEFDIVKVEIPIHLMDLVADTKSVEWKQPVKKMTLSEIEAELGYKIEIVKNSRK